MPRPQRPAPHPDVQRTVGLLPTSTQLRRRDGRQVVDRPGVSVGAGTETYRFFVDGNSVGLWVGCHHETVTAEEAIELGHELVQLGWDVVEARP